MLRNILLDAVARAHFLSEEGDIDSAMLRLGTAPKKRGIASELEAALQSMKHVPWRTLADFRGDQALLKKIEEAEALLQSLRKSLSS